MTESTHIESPDETPGAPAGEETSPLHVDGSQSEGDGAAAEAVEPQGHEELASLRPGPEDDAHPADPASDTAAETGNEGQTSDGDEEAVAEKPRRKRRGGDVESEAARVLEALLFASGEILTPAKLKGIIPGDPDARQIRAIVDKINGELQSQRHPFQIVDVAGGYQFRTVPYYSPWVRQLLKEKATKRLSIQALECLAIIAYRQPITRAEIEGIRGTLSDGAMKTLLERRMVTIAGRSEKAGRPLLYGTTRDFLSYFGLRDIDELPRIEEFEAMAKEKMGDIAQELQQMQQERSGTEASLQPDEGLPQIERDDGTVPRQTAESLDEEGLEPESREKMAGDGTDDKGIEHEHDDGLRDNPPEQATEPQ